MIIKFASHENAHAVADALEGVGVACEVYPVDVSEARPWFVDFSDAVELPTRDLPPTPMPGTEIESHSGDSTRSDSDDHTHDEELTT